MMSNENEDHIDISSDNFLQNQARAPKR